MNLEFKNKAFTTLSTEQKIAFTERVCMDHYDYLKKHGLNTAGLAFIKYWADNITSITSPSNSKYLEHYTYVEGQGLCVLDSKGESMSVRFNTKEILAFINNVINPIPFRSPIVDAIARGIPLEELSSKGVLADSYGNHLPNAKGMKGMKKGKKVDPDSLAQKIKRGEISRYQAYQKKYSDDEVL